MAHVEAECPLTVPSPEARRRAEEFARRMAERFALDWEWEGDTLRFTASSGAARGVRGHLAIGGDSVQVRLDVPLLLRPLRGTLEAKASALLNDTFGQARTRVPAG